MKNAAIDQEKAILNPKAAKKIYQIARYEPSKDLVNFIHHYWIVRWDLRGKEPYTQEVLPHPSINVVIEKEYARIIGVVSKKASEELKDRHIVFAAMFQPGGFYPFSKIPIARLTDKHFNFQEFFTDSKQLQKKIFSQNDEKKMVDIFEKFLRKKLPKLDPNITLVNAIIDTIISNHSLYKVDDFIKQFNLSKRTLQRLFHDYVGVSPKWVIRLYRLQNAAERLATSDKINLTQLALELGYFDETHFTKDFKAIIGKSPLEYKQNL